MIVGFTFRGFNIVPMFGCILPLLVIVIAGIVIIVVVIVVIIAVVLIFPFHSQSDHNTI